MAMTAVVGLAVSPGIGAAIRRATGSVRELELERFPGEFVHIVGMTDSLVGGSAFAAALAIVLGTVLFRRHKVVVSIVGALALASCGILAAHSTAAYDGEARELVAAYESEVREEILLGMCNSGHGSSGEQVVDGSKIEYALSGDCDALVLWSGETEIRRIPAPDGAKLDLHAIGAESRRGAHFVAARTWTEEKGGPYRLVIFRLDQEAETQSFALHAPHSVQGSLILGREGRFVFERQVDGVEMVTAVDPDTGKFVWNVVCPKGWDFLHLLEEGTMRFGMGDTLSCTRGTRIRGYKLDMQAGKRGELIEERDW